MSCNIIFLNQAYNLIIMNSVIVCRTHTPNIFFHRAVPSFYNTWLLTLFLILCSLTFYVILCYFYSMNLGHVYYKLQILCLSICRLRPVLNILSNAFATVSPRLSFKGSIQPNLLNTSITIKRYLKPLFHLLYFLHFCEIRSPNLVVTTWNNSSLFKISRGWFM